MLHFEWPWLFLLLPLPLLLRWWLRPRTANDEAALQVPFLEDFLPSQGQRPGRPPVRWPFWLALLAWLLLVVAAARPAWLGEAVQLPVSGRDLLLAVDLSGSMEVKDFAIKGDAVDRLSAAKWVAGDFIERRVGDRIGLILFGRHAYLQAPLTFDRKTVRTLLDEAAIGLAGKETAIGNAIGLAIKRLKEQPAKARVLILLTDGANTAGEVEPVKAAEMAKQAGLKIYTIGIGADELLIPTFFGNRRVNPSSELDEESLQAIAATTGGRYFRARDTAELTQIYQLLDQLEPLPKEEQSYRPTSPLFFWPLGVSLLLATLLALRNNATGIRQSR
jgi:Ca-activated chloride channel family protein